MEELPSPDGLVATAAKYLIEGGDDEAASVLLSCDGGTPKVINSGWVGSEYYCTVAFELRGPRAACDILDNEENAIHALVLKALNAALPTGFWLERIDIRSQLASLDPNWRADLLELAKGKGISNQAVGAGNAKTWKVFRFRSVTEIRIAEALARAGVLFFPLPGAWLGDNIGRGDLEPDFLICKDGKWGILEVDGEPYHPPQRTVHDHQRDKRFQQHGVKFVQHRDSTDCYVTPDKVVAEFLELLDKIYQ